MIISGQDGYSSPDWYGIEQQVPTWNYLAVHLQGALQPLPDAELRPLLGELSDEFERRLAPKPIWKMSKLSDENRKRFERMIQPFEMTLTSVDMTAKLGQNKPSEARMSAATALEKAQIGQENAALAEMMRKV